MTIQHKPNTGRGGASGDERFEETSSNRVLELTTDALGWIDRELRLQPLNTAARQLLSHVEQAIGRPPVMFEDLPLAADDREALRSFFESGEAALDAILTLECGTTVRYLSARFVSDELRPGWHFCFHDETAVRVAEARVMRQERSRVLSRLASGIVHDINNIMGALLGFADHLAATTRDADEKQFLTRLLRGTRESANMLQRLNQLLRKEPVRREAVSLQQLVANSLQLFHKTAAIRGIEVTAEFAKSLPTVRVVPEDATLAILHLLLYSAASASAPAPITVQVAAETRAALHRGLPTRPYGVIRLLDLGDMQEAQALVTLLQRAEQGLQQHIEQLSGDRSGLLLTILALAFHGAFFEIEPARQGRRCMALWFPAVRREG